MLRNVIFCAFLLGCANQEHVATKQAALARENPPFTYFLIPSRNLLEREYQIQVDIANIEPAIFIEEARLRRWALEGAVSVIAGTLDEKYGEQVDGEFFPGTGLLIVKADVQLDLTILTGLIEND